MDNSDRALGVRHQSYAAAKVENYATMPPETWIGALIVRMLLRKLLASADKVSDDF